MILIGVGGVPHLLLMRSDALMEISGFVVVGLQFLTRRRYQQNRTLFVGDGIRHLLTFAALLFMEYVKLNVHMKYKAISAAPGQLELSLAALQILILTAVSGFTIWLQSPHALAFAATMNAARPRAVVNSQNAVKPVRPVQPPGKKGAKR